MKIDLSFSRVLIAAAVVFFCLAAAGVSFFAIPLVPLGLACGFASFLV